MAAPDSTAIVHNMLLGLAWLGALDRTQIQRLWFPHKSESTVTKLLTELRRDGLIEPRHWSIRDSATNTTRPQLARWSLTSAGQAQIKSSDQYPSSVARPRQRRLMAHDLRTVATIVRLLELARPAGLCGVYVEYEVRLSPTQRRPICDALVLIQLSAHDSDGLVPWSKDPPLAGEACVRFAIEADNDTEPQAVIAGKAYAYRQMHHDPAWAAWWVERYGTAPYVVWVVPDVPRVETIHSLWKKTWPDGSWWVTTDIGLARNSLHDWNRGDEYSFSLNFAKARPLPPPPAAPALPEPATDPPLADEHAAATLPSDAAQPSGDASQPSSDTAAPSDAPSVGAEAATPAGADEASATVAGGQQTLEQPARVVVRMPSIPPEPPIVNPPLPWQARCWRWLTEALGLLATPLVWLLIGGLMLLVWVYEALEARRLVRPVAGVLASALLVLLLSRPVVDATPALLADLQQRIVLLSLPSLPPLPTLPAVTAPAQEPPAAMPTPTPRGCAQVRVIAKRVNLRTEPGLHGEILRVLTPGEVLDVLRCEAVAGDGYTWLRVIGARDVLPGWVAREFVEGV